PTGSVILVSHGRPELLARALTGVAQLLYSEFEVVVVADAAGLEAVAGLPFADQIKLVGFEEANISAARNLGVARAAGEIVAFLDDDAVPEPTWLRNLVAPFADHGVAAAGGYVIGRNGISLQWGAGEVDETGQTHSLALQSDVPQIVPPAAGRAIRTEGTNCAFRRSVLASLGGFDPNYKFYLDETDLNMRLARAGHATALVPQALVHHGFAASARRTAERAPRSLFEIGASSLVYLRKFAPPGRRADAVSALIAAQKSRALKHMIAGRIEPHIVGVLMQDLSDGIAEGQNRTLVKLPELPAPCAGFLGFVRPGASGQSRLIHGRIRQAGKLHQKAQEMVEKGDIVTVFLFGASAIYHQHRFHSAGYWEQRGGLFGRAVRTEPLFRLTGFKQRVATEKRRIFRQRALER
ncbi:MAG: glycosyltransferase family 2 protein, partial [Halocynthiibacter sp.]